MSFFYFLFSNEYILSVYIIIWTKFYLLSRLIFRNFWSISELKLEGNEMTDLVSTCQLIHQPHKCFLDVEKIYLAHNNISAMVPGYWLERNNLHYLDLRHNQIHNLTVRRYKFITDG